MQPVASVRILDSEVSLVDMTASGQTVLSWAMAGESRVVCATNVHMIMEAHDDSELASLLRDSDLSVADGMPVVWALRLLGHDAHHVRGAHLVLEALARAEAATVPAGLYGSSPETLEQFQAFLGRQFPALKIPFSVSPPFRQLTPAEDKKMAESIRESGARILLVGLGCPKQERWMMEHRGRLPCVMLGVGAAFDFLAGTMPEAPRWMQRAGLEWLFRLTSDPRRLYRRYFKHNPRFVLLFGYQWARHVLGRS